MKLTDKAVKAAKPREKLYRIFDGEGLYLEIHPSGAKYWRMKCIFAGKEQRLAFGVYPQVTLAQARERRQGAKDALKQGKNPKYAISGNTDRSFKAVATEWHNTQKGTWSDKYAATVLHRLEMDVFPRLGSSQIANIDAQDILAVIRAIDGRGAPVKAKRVLRYINSIFSFAIITMGEMRYSPAIGLHIAIKTKPIRHNPHLQESELPEFLKRLDEYKGGEITRLATKFLLLTMTRTSEVRLAKFNEIDWENNIWKIPPERMKMRRTHWVPLSRQAVDVLKRAAEFGGDYIFPSFIRKGRPISENTILYAIYDMGYRGKLTAHGFRGTASTILNEKGYNSLAIERQLAHIDKNGVRASYNHAEYFNERRVLLQDWAYLLDALQNS